MARWAFAGILAFVGLVVVIDAGRTPTTFVIHASSPVLSISALAAAADDVILVAGTGHAQGRFVDGDVTAQLGLPHMIVTDHTVDLIEARSGLLPQSAVIRQGGGSLDGFTVFVDGAEKSFDLGKQYVLFVRREADSSFTIVGPGIGTFILGPDGDWHNQAGQTLESDELAHILTSNP